jgi:hypothetical protein
MEVHELIDSILYRLAELEKLSVEWLRFTARADELRRAVPAVVVVRVPGSLAVSK